MNTNIVLPAEKQFTASFFAGTFYLKVSNQPITICALMALVAL
jgi:hypothetical protein